MGDYTITWTEESHHTVTLSGSELADLLGISVDDLEARQDPDEDVELCDRLADLDDDGFQWVQRLDIDVTRSDA